MNTTVIYTPKPLPSIPCKGEYLESPQPNNTYHVSQRAWLEEKKLYTGRFIVDVAHLPAHLKQL